MQQQHVSFHDCLKYTQFIHEYACFIRESLKFIFYLQKKQSYIYFVKLNILYTYFVDAKFFDNSSAVTIFSHCDVVAQIRIGEGILESLTTDRDSSKHIAWNESKHRFLEKIYIKNIFNFE